jgi:hypothetical protein
MPAYESGSVPRLWTHDPPRILLFVGDDEKRSTLASALRDTGYEVFETPKWTDDEAERVEYDLIVADGDRPLPGPTPTLLLPEPFDVVEVEMTLLDLLGWDGPPTVRRAPIWSAVS